MTEMYLPISSYFKCKWIKLFNQKIEISKMEKTNALNIVDPGPTGVWTMQAHGLFSLIMQSALCVPGFPIFRIKQLYFWSTAGDLHMWRANLSYTQVFNCTGPWCPQPPFCLRVNLYVLYKRLTWDTKIQINSK